MRNVSPINEGREIIVLKSKRRCFGVIQYFSVGILHNVWNYVGEIGVPPLEYYSILQRPEDTHV